MSSEPESNKPAIRTRETRVLVSATAAEMRGMKNEKGNCRSMRAPSTRPAPCPPCRAAATVESRNGWPEKACSSSGLSSSEAEVLGEAAAALRNDSAWSRSCHIIAEGPCRQAGSTSCSSSGSRHRARSLTAFSRALSAAPHFSVCL